MIPNIELEVLGTGRLHNGLAHIYEGNPPENEFGTLSYHPASEFDGEMKPHQFQSVIHIPESTFNYLSTLNMKVAALSMWISFDKLDNSFTYDGFDPDDEGIIWDTRQKPFEIIESIDLVVEDL